MDATWVLVERVSSESADFSLINPTYLFIHNLISVCRVKFYNRYGSMHQ